MKKSEIAQKMVQHTYYDRATKKLVRTTVPQSKEHKERSDKINEHKHTEPSDKEKVKHQHRYKRAYND